MRGTLRPPALLVFALALVVVEVDGVQGHDVLEQLLPVHQVVHAQRQQSSASTSPDASAFVLPSMEEGPRKRGVPVVEFDDLGTVDLFGEEVLTVLGHALALEPLLHVGDGPVDGLCRLDKNMIKDPCEKTVLAHGGVRALVGTAGRLVHLW